MRTAWHRLAEEHEGNIAQRGGVFILVANGVAVGVWWRVKNRIQGRMWSKAPVGMGIKGMFRSLEVL